MVKTFMEKLYSYKKNNLKKYLKKLARMKISYYYCTTIR